MALVVTTSKYAENASGNHVTAAEEPRQVWGGAGESRATAAAVADRHELSASCHYHHHHRCCRQSPGVLRARRWNSAETKHVTAERNGSEKKRPGPTSKGGEGGRFVGGRVRFTAGAGAVCFSHSHHLSRRLKQQKRSQLYWPRQRAAGEWQPCKLRYASDWERGGEKVLSPVIFSNLL